MADTGDLKKGFKMLKDNEPWVCVDCQFVKPGKGQAFFRTKFKNMVNGRVVDHTFKSGEKLEKADTEEREMQYLYPEGDNYVFMDNTSYDQMTMTKEQLGDNVFFLLDNMNVQVMLFNERPIGVTPPTFVALEVMETDPGFKGDTSGNTTKPATVSTGLIVQVPLFVNVGDTLKVDTRDSSYVERVKV